MSKIIGTVTDRWVLPVCKLAHLHIKGQAAEGARAQGDPGALGDREPSSLDARRRLRRGLLPRADETRGGEPRDRTADRDELVESIREGARMRNETRPLHGEPVTRGAGSNARGLIAAIAVKCKFEMRDAGSASCGTMPFRGRSPPGDTGTGTECWGLPAYTLTHLHT